MSKNLKNALRFIGIIFTGFSLFVPMLFFLYPNKIKVDSLFFFISLSSFFFIIGMIILMRVIKDSKRERIVKLNGRKRVCKIYDLVDSNDLRINGIPAVNLLLRYVDDNGLVRERLAITNADLRYCPFTYGQTIDAYEYQGSFAVDEKSLRDEILSREDELMSKEPLDMFNYQKETIIKCQNCGAMYQATKNTASKCPYCGSHNSAF